MAVTRVASYLRTSRTQNQIKRSLCFFGTTKLNDSTKVHKLFDQILQLDTVEVALLTELVNEKLGLKPLILTGKKEVARGANNVGLETGSTAEQSKTTYGIKLTGFDPKSKIKVIKEIRTMTGLGLKEAKQLVEGAPIVVKSEIEKEEAEELKSKLESVGAIVEVA